MSDFKDYTDYTENENNGFEITEMPKQKKPHRKLPKKTSALMKKAGAITLSAMLFGGVAAGAFQGVNYLSGYSTNTSSTTQQTSLIRTTATGGSSDAAGSLDVSDIASAAMPSIVSITNKSVQEVQSIFNSFGYSYQQPQTEETESCGSGIIIGKNDTELLIVTNNHVVEGSDTLSVSFIDNQVCEAQIKGTDADNDLAVIAVPLDSISSDTMSSIAVATLGNSDELQVGEQVVAIGNALGYGQSVTTGIVSATNRSLSSSEDGSADTNATYIQTDAAINPGNSGGALLNMNGEVIGINSAKLASTEVEGMGYAIPVSRASDIIERLMNETTRTKVSEDNQGTLDIQCRDVSSELSSAYGIPEGIYVAEVSKGGAAEQAGINQGYVITKFDGNSVTTTQQLKDRLQYYASGEKVTITVQVPDNGSYSEQTLDITLGSSNTNHAAA